MYYCPIKILIMKTIDILKLIGFIAIFGLLSSNFNTGESNISLALFIIIPILIYGFNFIVRTNYNFKPYFTSKINFLTSKYDSSISSDLSIELMYQKMIEVINNSELKLVYEDQNKLEILATKGMSWSSWGENIYIEFSEKKGKTIMNFTSTTVLGIISWGKNGKNYNRLLSTFEESLTI